ncbi:MAG: malonate decarboxylase holo-[acyl-carrier-protein] synthase [Bradyrhizobium sp.]
MTLPCNPTERPAGRHDLVFVSPQGFRGMLAARGDLAGNALVARWADEGWPMIRRRAIPADSSGVPLGLPLPPSTGKKRLCFVSQPDDIVSVARPPSLNRARGSAPSAWRPTLERLDALALAHSMEVRVFGSLAWRTLTGLNYLTGRSDLDLLLDVGRDTDLDRLTADVAAIEAKAPMRLDGELMRDDGAAVNWREFHAGASEVLVKHIDGVGLLDRRHFASGKTLS